MEAADREGLQSVEVHSYQPSWQTYLEIWCKICHAFVGQWNDQARYLEGGPLIWMLPQYLHINQKSNDDGDDEDDETIWINSYKCHFFFPSVHKQQESAIIDNNQYKHYVTQ